MVRRYAFVHFFLMFYSTVLQACLAPETQPVPATIKPAMANAVPRQVVIYNNASLNRINQTAEVTLLDAKNRALIDRIHWPVGAGSNAAILAAPALLDSNHDGLTDAVYLIDVNGLLWFVGLGRSGFSAPELIADFSASGYQFMQQVELVQTRSPVLSGQLVEQNMLLITAINASGHSVLIALKHRLLSGSVARLADLTDRSTINADEMRYGIAESLWAQMQQSAGWYVRLSGQIISTPKVYAGVVYLLSAKPEKVSADCQLALDADAALHSFHLHHAGLVYSHRSKAVQPQYAGELTLLQHQNGLQLVVTHQQTQHSLESNLVAISAECADCTEPLTPNQFPQLIRLATFLAEYGAH